MNLISTFCGLNPGREVVVKHMELMRGVHVGDRFGSDSGNGYVQRN